MPTVSLCMIVKNEEDVLARCLESVRGFADEVVVLDTGSTDGTREAARACGARVEEMPWPGDFAAARNRSFSYGTGDYLFWLDADDVLLPEARAVLLAWKAAGFYGADAVFLPYHTGLDANGAPALVYCRERLFRREKGFFWEGAVHEAVAVSGVIRHCPAAVTHQKARPGDPERNLRILERVAGQRPLSARELYYYGRELYALGRFPQAARRFRQFLRRPDGWEENRADACRLLALCEEQRGRPRLRWLLEGLRCGAPRAELCCELGRFFLEEGRPKDAAFWYALALTRELREDDGAFHLRDCYGFLLCIQLCVCYDRMGDWRTAERYNEMAGHWKPEDPAYLYNKEYFLRKKQ